MTLVSFHESFVVRSWVNITSSNSASDNNVRIVFTMAPSDLNRIKKRPAICTTAGNCWIRFAAGFVRDMAGLPIAALQPGSFRSSDIPLELVEDSTPPSLIGLIVDMQQVRITLTWDEPVISDSLQPKLVLFHNAVSSTPQLNTTAFQLTDFGKVPGNNNETVSFWLAATDVTRIKALVGLLKSLSSSFVSANGLVTDLAGNVGDVTSFAATTYNADVSPPTVASLRFYDANTATFRLRFSEPVDIATFSLPRVTLQSTVNDTAAHHTFVENGTVSYLAVD